MAGGDVVSALVVLRLPGGREMDHTEVVTAANVAQFTAAPDDRARVDAYFADRGFETAPAGPLALSITGPARIFEDRFGTPLSVSRVPSGMAVTCAGSLELPLDALPEAIRGAVQAVAFSAPPDFGPGNP